MSAGFGDAATPKSRLTIRSPHRSAKNLRDLAELPRKYGVSKVYGDLGAIFASTVIAQSKLAAAMMGTLIKGLRADHVIWGTDLIWTARRNNNVMVELNFPGA